MKSSEPEETEIVTGRVKFLKAQWLLSVQPALTIKIKNLHFAHKI
jgi:hypothetical protein